MKANLRMFPNSHQLCFWLVGGFSAFPSHSNPHSKSHHTSLPNQWKSYAILDSVILAGAILSKKDEIRKGVILSKSIIGWKKCEGRVIVKLRIPKGAVVFSINGKKCRTNKCKVISIDSIGNDNTAISMYDNNFTYTVGKVIEIDNFDLSYNVECGTGIHFFLSEEDARNYN